MQPVWAGHPWVFPQGIERREGKIEHGDEVVVLDARGNAMGRGLFADKSPIAVRLFTTNPEEELNVDCMVHRLEASVRLRAAVGLPMQPQTSGYRAFHGEGDGLPGLIVDRFDDVLVVQLGTAGMARRRKEILSALWDVFAPRTIIERTSERVALAERFDAQSGVVLGEPLEELSASELGIRYRIPLYLSQKTGFYFDQRPLRRRIEELSSGRTVLDTYSFVGAIGLAAARGGARSVLCIDSSAPAVELGAQLALDNQLRVDFARVKALTFFEQTPKKYDLVIADPPKLAQSRSGRDKAMRAFRKICSGAVSATDSDGIVVVSSCSSALGIDQVERCLALGAGDAGRRVAVFDRVFQGQDHPVPPAFPEGRYLSTALAYVY